MSERSQALILWWSLIFTVIYILAFVGLQRMVPLLPPSLPPAEVAAFYSEHAFSMKLGAMITSWTSGFFIPFSLVVGLQLARMEEGKPVWSILAIAAGSLTSLFIVLPSIMWGIAAFTTSRSPEMTATLNEIACLLFTTTCQFYVFLLIPIVYVGLKAKPNPNAAFPRWLSWATMWVVVIAEAGAIGFLFKTGPFAWNGLFVFWLPFGAYFLWLFPMYYCMFRALRRQMVTNNP